MIFLYIFFYLGMCDKLKDVVRSVYRSEGTSMSQNLHLAVFYKRKTSKEKFVTKTIEAKLRNNIEIPNSNPIFRSETQS